MFKRCRTQHDTRAENDDGPAARLGRTWPGRLETPACRHFSGIVSCFRPRCHGAPQWPTHSMRLDVYRRHESVHNRSKPKEAGPCSPRTGDASSATTLFSIHICYCMISSSYTGNAALLPFSPPVP